MKTPTVYKGGYKGASIGILASGVFCAIFISMFNELRFFALPIFIISFLIAFLFFLDSLMPLVKIDQELLTFYTGFLLREPTIRLDLYNIDNVHFAERGKKVILKPGLLVPSVRTTFTREGLLIKLKEPPEIASLNRLRYTGNFFNGFNKYFLGDSDLEILICIPPNAGFKDLQQSIYDRIKIDKEEMVKG